MIPAPAPPPQKPTAILINLVLLALLASLLLLLSVVWNEAPEAVPHVAFLLLLFGGLAAAVNWFLANVGLADVAAQRAELNLDGDAGGAPRAPPARTHLMGEGLSALLSQSKRGDGERERAREWGRRAREKPADNGVWFRSIATPRQAPPRRGPYNESVTRVRNVLNNEED